MLIFPCHICPLQHSQLWPHPFGFQFFVRVAVRDERGSIVKFIEWNAFELNSCQEQHDSNDIERLGTRDTAETTQSTKTKRQKNVREKKIISNDFIIMYGHGSRTRGAIKSAECVSLLSSVRRRARGHQVSLSIHSNELSPKNHPLP